MTSWVQSCKPCQDGNHYLCQEKLGNPCDCKANNHGKPRVKRVGKHRKKKEPKKK